MGVGLFSPHLSWAAGPCTHPPARAESILTPTTALTSSPITTSHPISILTPTSLYQSTTWPALVRTLLVATVRAPASLVPAPATAAPTRALAAPRRTASARLPARSARAPRTARTATAAKHLASQPNKNVFGGPVQAQHLDRMTTRTTRKQHRSWSQGSRLSVVLLVAQ